MWAKQRIQIGSTPTSGVIPSTQLAGIPPSKRNCGGYRRGSTCIQKVHLLTSYSTRYISGCVMVIMRWVHPSTALQVDPNNNPIIHVEQPLSSPMPLAPGNNNAFRPWFSVLSGVLKFRRPSIALSACNELLATSGDSHPGPRVNQPFHLPLGLY